MIGDSHFQSGRRFNRAALRFEQLEDRSVPAAGFTPNNFGGGIFTPFDDFSGQVNAASGDVTGDGIDDIIVAHGLGAGSSSRVRVFDGAAARGGRVAIVADFFAYSDSPGASVNPGFAGGVFVAAADFDGDGSAELVTSTGAGGFGHLKVFNFRNTFGQFLGNNPILQTSFYAYPGFLGDIRVETINRAGQTPLLVTASGAGTSDSDIRIFANPLAIGSVAVGTFVQPDAQTFVFPGYRGGVSIATGDTNQDSVDELFVSTITGPPVVTTFALVPPGSTPFLFPGSTFPPGSAPAAFGLFPGVTFQTGPAPQSDIRLGSADVNFDGRDEILVSFVNNGVNSPIGVFALNANGVTQLAPITGFQGFGYFGFINASWLASSTFTAPGGVVGGSTTFTTTGTTFTTGGTAFSSTVTPGSASFITTTGPFLMF